MDRAFMAGVTGPENRVLPFRLVPLSRYKCYFVCVMRNYWPVPYLVKPSRANQLVCKLVCNVVDDGPLNAQSFAAGGEA